MELKIYVFEIDMWHWIYMGLTESDARSRWTKWKMGLHLYAKYDKIHYYVPS